MSRTKTSRKFLAMFLSLMMVLALPPMSAFAVESTNTLSGYGADVGSLVVSGADVQTAPVTAAASDNGNTSNMTYTYNIVLSGTTSSTAAVTATFAKAAGSGCTISTVPRISNQPVPTIPAVQAHQSLTFSSTLSSGIGTVTAYVFPNLTGNFTRFDTYVFNFTTSALNNPVTAGNGLQIRFGDPGYPNTAPECYMSLAGSGNAYTATYSGPLSDYFPSSLALYITQGAGGITSISGTSGTVTLKAYDSDGNLVESGSRLTAHKTDGFYVVELSAGTTRQLSIANANGTAVITFSAPGEATAASGSAPDSVQSYLPIGQFATGAGWGSATGKFVKTAADNGFESTGVSLGAFGGYIEYHFDAGITDNIKNPYGVDFVVYGNAFNGNPEAGAVQVSEDGTTWYELAGSMYYDSGFAATGAAQASGKFTKAYTGTLRDASVTYTLNSAGVNAAMTNGAGSIAADPFTSAAAWWPSTSEYADSVIAAAHKGNLTIARSGDTAGSTLAFGGITAVQDDDTNASYAFGYADVTPNGSPSTYGDAVNPYTTYTSSKTGGDGFDLEWAVDISTGLPVDVSSRTFHYVRVYSAVLDNGTFGETSTEVCGIFTTANPVSGTTAGTTAAPASVVFSNANNSNTYTVPTLPATGNYVSCMRAIQTYASRQTGGAAALTLTINAASGANVYVNSLKLTESSAGVYTGTISIPEASQKLRVIVQSGIAAPYVGIIG